MTKRSEFYSCVFMCVCVVVARQLLLCQPFDPERACFLRFRLSLTLFEMISYVHLICKPCVVFFHFFFFIIFAFHLLNIVVASAYISICDECVRCMIQSLGQWRGCCHSGSISNLLDHLKLKLFFDSLSSKTKLRNSNVKRNLLFCFFLMSCHPSS